MIGTSLNQYRIIDAVGVGGMGMVFRARDTRLDRDVALKMLPHDLVSDPERQRRFEREAKLLASLNHPNILTIHDAGVHEGKPYLATELLDGRTLREELNGGPLAVRKATDYALQIAHGLAAAHAKGIIHRDLKPENIFVTKNGHVKILDFGLAKLSEVERGAPTAPANLDPEDGSLRTAIPTTVNLTEPGMVLGTPAYMSPEQVRGEPTDHRTDIFAFGCVLYEIFSGKMPFKGDSTIATMNAILTEEPPDLPIAHPNLGPALNRVVQKCLAKDREERWQTAKDLADELRWVAQTVTGSQSAYPNFTRLRPPGSGSVTL